MLHMQRGMDDLHTKYTSRAFAECCAYTYIARSGVVQFVDFMAISNDKEAEFERFVCLFGVGVGCISISVIGIWVNKSNVKLHAMEHFVGETSALRIDPVRLSTDFFYRRQQQRIHTCCCSICFV